jgi:SAM-dependent methyltransferase
MTPLDSQVYYTGIYWNSYDRVIRHLNRRAYDSEDGSWWQFARSQRANPYERALSLNCGTGWVERDLIRDDLVRSIVALDYLDDLLDTARTASVGLPIEYVQADVNVANLPAGPFDLAVNHAAGHHITNVDAVFRRLGELLGEDGTLVTWDYTGPHRNQYGRRAWEAAAQVNLRLPEEYRSPMDYPHLRTMLVTDPTEAVHSELVDETMDRYFTHTHRRRLGGPIAYHLLTHNERLYNAPTDERDDLIDIVLSADVAHVDEFPEDNLFTFAISHPRRVSEFDFRLLDQWSRKEVQREEEAAANDGRYYVPTVIEQLMYGDEETNETEQPEPVFDWTPNDAARQGLRFNLSSFVRSFALRFPVLLVPLNVARRLTRRSHPSPASEPADV